MMFYIELVRTGRKPIQDMYKIYNEPIQNLNNLYETYDTEENPWSPGDLGQGSVTLSARWIEEHLWQRTADDKKNPA